MSHWTLGEITECLGVSLASQADPRTPLLGVSTDTRTLRAGSVFVPLVGERFDGHDHVEEAARAGAKAILWGRSSPPPSSLAESGAELLRVSDTLQAYQALGLAHKVRCGVRCVAITGSIGKTTTKEFLAHLLSGSLRVHKSAKNFNNDIGVPLTLLELRPEHDVVVLEMGMRGPGEIERLRRCSEPEVGLITGIGTSHLELLGSREAIARAKAELISGLPKGGQAVLPRDDEFYPLLAELANVPVLTYSSEPFGSEEEVADYAPGRILSEDSAGTRFELAGKPWYLPLPGRHHLHDLFAALAAGRALGVELEQMLFRVNTLVSPEGRAQWLQWAGARFFLDAYNSAPESLRASLAVLGSCEGRKLAVLGDMLELGDSAQEIHRQAGLELAEYGVDLVIGVGPMTRYLVESADQAGVKAAWFASKEDLAAYLRQELRPGDAVLIKASRGIALESVLETLKKERV